MPIAIVLVALSVLDLGQVKVAQPGPEPSRAVVELFEDDADGLLKLLTNPGDGPGKGDAESEMVFSGKRSLKISE